MYTYYFHENKLPRKLQLRLNKHLQRTSMFLILVACIRLIYFLIQDRNTSFRGAKTILLWSHTDYAPFYYFGEGKSAFIRNNCSNTNCYVTSNRYLLDDVTEFDAIAFNGRRLFQTWSQLPKRRSPRQKYIYVNMESADYFPTCNEIYDGFFNWTATYRLDSDIPLTYVLVKNKNGKTVGPKLRMEWEKNMDSTGSEIVEKLRGKNKTVAWFASNCYTRSRRQNFVKKLQKELLNYGLKIDIFGKCGSFRCPQEHAVYCERKIEKQYYFYLALENSLAVDYVSEKVLWALNHNAVPIVYGGADYTRFLPPGSFLSGSPQRLAAIIAESVKNFSRYKDFFKWKKYYTFSNPTATDNVCALCTALNNKTLMETKTVYREFRKWWNPNFKISCQ